MAYDISVTGAFSGRPTYDILLYVRRNQTDIPNNRSSYAWQLQARRISGTPPSYDLASRPWNVLIGPTPFSGNGVLDFRSTNTIILGSGTTGWFSHNSSGQLSLLVAASMQNAGLFGSAFADGTFVTDPIPQLPAAPNAVAGTPDQITTTSLRYRFTDGANGGAPILERQAQIDDDPAFGSPTTISSNGTTTFSGLAPGTEFHLRARVRNVKGWGPYGAAASGTTLPAVPPGMTVTPNLAGTQATVALTPPSGIGSVTSYRVERRPVGGVATVYDSATSPIVVTGLTPGTIYEWRASAFIGSYQSPWTDWTPIVQPNPNTNPGDYFDGSTPDRTDTDFQWSSTVNNSTSLAVGTEPLGWRAFADGDSDSGGAGVVTRSTGGRSGAFGARVTFFADTTAPGFRGGTALEDPGVQEVAEGGVYWGSVYVSPSRAQRMAAEIIWLDAAFVEIGSSAIGDPIVVAANPVPMQRLVASGVAPAGAVYGAAGWVDVAGDDWAPWLGGDTVMQDDAMLSIGELLPWFSGDTPDTAEFSYEWLGDPNESVSVRTTLDVADTDPLADPDCPPVPSPPSPPPIDDDCIDEVGTWRRYWAIIPEDQVAEWLALVATISITTGALAARQVRIRVYANPDGLAPSDFPADTWDAEQIISYIPPLTVLTLDGVAQRVWAEVNGGDSIAADRLLYGTGGGPATWPVLSCGTAYLISFDVPLDAPEGNLSVDIALTTRML